jgi:hypothetical protein
VTRLLSIVCILIVALCYSQNSAADVFNLEFQEGCANKVSIQAESLLLFPENDSLTARGNVRLSTAGLVIQGESLVLKFETGNAEIFRPVLHLPEHRLTISSLKLNLSVIERRIHLIKPQLKLNNNGLPLLIFAKQGTCNNGLCSLEMASGTTCPHSPVGYHISAKKIQLHPSGDIDLTVPVLMLGDSKVAALPWIRIRPAGSSGFLPPRLGWDRDGGFIVGPAGYIPFNKSAFAKGHIAARTSQGFESQSIFHMPHLDVTFDYLLDHPDSLVRFRLDSTPQLNQASLAVAFDIVNDRQVIDDLANNYLDRATTHTATRGLLATSLQGTIIETYIEYLQAFTPHGNISPYILSPSASLALSLPATPLAQFLWPGINLKLTRYGLSKTAWLPDAANGLVPGHSRFELSPDLSIPGRLGPLYANISAGSRHHFWFPDRTSLSTRSSVHVAAFAVNASLPLARNYRRLRHYFAPFTRYRITPFVEGTTPFWVVDDFDRLRRGHGIELGISTKLSIKKIIPMLQLEIIERFDLPGWQATPGPAYLEGSGRIGPNWFGISFEGAWDHEHSLPSTATLTLHKKGTHHNSLDIGGRWVGPGRGPHRDRPFSPSLGPWLISTWPGEPSNALEMFEQTEIEITKNTVATIGARVGLWPQQSLHALLYGLEFRSQCGCFSAGIQAAHRLESAVPDIMTTLQLTGF